MSMLTLDETAAKIGYRNPKTFRNNIRTLIDNEGFPARLPSGCWYAPAVERWLLIQSGITPPPSLDPAFAALALQSEALDAHYRRKMA